MKDDDLSPPELRELFLVVCQALTFDALRMKPREKQLVLLLALESLGKGSECGVMDMEGWRLRLASWRSNELADMIEFWRRAGMIAVDVTEKTFRLAPEQFPGWANVQAIIRSQRETNGELTLRTEDDLHKTFAKISQKSAAKISQGFTKISQIPVSDGGLGGNVPETFIRSDVKRLNVQRSDAGAREGGPNCENFAKPDVVTLMERVRKFVGEADWQSESFWNSGRGWRGRLFSEEGRTLEGALDYCVAGLKQGNVNITKTRGAMLWDQFQRLRREQVPG